MNLRETIQLHGGGPGSGCNPEAGKCGRPAGRAEERAERARQRALEQAKRDPRQTSLYGPGHEKELQPSKPVKVTKKMFRELLNRQDLESRNPISHKHGPYHQIKRPYGDYIWHQDRAMFDWHYEMFKQAGGDFKKYLEHL